MIPNGFQFQKFIVSKNLTLPNILLHHRDNQPCEKCGVLPLRFYLLIFLYTRNFKNEKQIN